MRLNCVLPGLLWLVLLGVWSSGSDVNAQSVALEIRRFALMEGVTFPKEFPDFFYALLVEKINEAQLTSTVLGENEVPDPSCGDLLVLQGTILGSKGAWYKGAGEKKLTVEVILRRGANETLLKKEISAGPNIFTRVSYEDENELWSAAALADRVVKEIRSFIGKNLPARAKPR